MTRLITTFVAAALTRATGRPHAAPAAPPDLLAGGRRPATHTSAPAPRVVNVTTACLLGHDGGAMAPPRPAQPTHLDTYPDPDATDLTCRLFGHVRTLAAPSRCYCGHDLGDPTTPTTAEARPMPTRPTTPPPAPTANHTAVVRRRRSLARHTALAAFCWTWGACGLSTALAAALWAAIIAALIAGLWTTRHRFLIDEYAAIEQRHQMAEALHHTEAR